MWPRTKPCEEVVNYLEHKTQNMEAQRIISKNGRITWVARQWMWDQWRTSRMWVSKEHSKDLMVIFSPYKRTQKTPSQSLTSHPINNNSLTQLISHLSLYLYAISQLFLYDLSAIYNFPVFHNQSLSDRFKHSIVHLFSISVIRFSAFLFIKNIQYSLQIFHSL